jgi:hypothetical protein
MVTAVKTSNLTKTWVIFYFEFSKIMLPLTKNCFYEKNYKTSTFLALNKTNWIGAAYMHTLHASM